jgi:prevent-host-death family protein
MVKVGVREFKQNASDLLRLVREEGQEIQVTYHGKVVAVLVPVKRADTQDDPHSWVEIDLLAAEIGARWPAGVSAAEAIAEDRR